MSAKPEKQADPSLPNLSETQKMLCDFYAFICAAADYYKGPESDYYESAVLDADSMEAKSFRGLHYSPEVYLKAKTYALKLGNPEADLDMIYDWPCEFPTAFNLSAAEEAKVREDLALPGFVSYLESPAFHPAPPESKKS